MTGELCCLHPGGLNFTEYLVKTAHLECGESVLDAGCGDGASVNWLRNQGYNACGIDRSPGVIEAWIQQGELQELPYDDSCFSAVLSECTAFICGDTDTALQQYYRVLKNSGWLLLADVFFKEDYPLPEFDDKRPVTEQQWRILLQKNGFEIYKMEDVSEAWKPFVIEQLWAGRTIEELWGGCLAKGQIKSSQYRPGYFLIWARKKGAGSDE